MIMYVRLVVCDRTHYMFQSYFSVKALVSSVRTVTTLLNSYVTPPTRLMSSSAKQALFTTSAPAPLGAYSQAIRAGNTVYLAGQIPLDVKTGKVVLDSIEAQAVQTFTNVKAVAEATGGTINDIVKLTIFITDFKYFPTVNSVMKRFFQEPYPARSTVGVASLGMGVDVEIEGILYLPDQQQSNL